MQRSLEHRRRNTHTNIDIQYTLLQSPFRCLTRAFGTPNCTLPTTTIQPISLFQAVPPTVHPTLHISPAQLALQLHVNKTGVTLSPQLPPHRSVFTAARLLLVVRVSCSTPSSPFILFAMQLLLFTSLRTRVRPYKKWMPPFPSSASISSSISPPPSSAANF